MSVELQIATLDPPWRRKVTPCPFYDKGTCLFSHRCNFIHAPRLTPPRSITYDPSKCPAYHNGRVLAREIAETRWTSHRPHEFHYSSDEDEYAVEEQSTPWTEEARSPTSALLQVSRSTQPSDDSLSVSNLPAPEQARDTRSPTESTDSSEAQGLRSFIRHRAKPTLRNAAFLASLSEKIEKRFGLVPPEPVAAKVTKSRMSPAPLPPIASTSILGGGQVPSTLDFSPLEGPPTSLKNHRRDDPIRESMPPANPIHHQEERRRSKKRRPYSDATTVRGTPSQSQDHILPTNHNRKHSASSNAPTPSEASNSLKLFTNERDDSDGDEPSREEDTARPVAFFRGPDVFSFQPEAESTEVLGRVQTNEDSLLSLYGGPSIGMTSPPLFPVLREVEMERRSSHVSNDHLHSLSDNSDFWTVPDIVGTKQSSADLPHQQHERSKGLRPLRLPSLKSHLAHSKLSLESRSPSSYTGRGSEGRQPTSGSVHSSFFGVAELTPPVDEGRPNTVGDQTDCEIDNASRGRTSVLNGWFRSRSDSLGGAQSISRSVSPLPQTGGNTLDRGSGSQLNRLANTPASPYHSTSKESLASVSRRSSLLSVQSRSSTASQGAKLYFAIASDSPSEVASLLENGQVTANERMGPQDALAFAAGNHRLQRRGEIVSLLVSHGADIASVVGSHPESDEQASAGEKPLPIDPYIEYLANRAQEEHQLFSQSVRKVARIPRFAALKRVPFGLVGQDLVLNEFFRAVAMQGLSEQISPLIMFLCGPSGHGKSLFARKIGEALDCPARTFNLTLLRQHQMIWDLSSIEDGDVEPVTVGQFLKDNDCRRSIVVLDEIEKTDNERTLWPLLVPWEFGHVTLGNGTNIKARETIWIATSNLGQELILGNPSNDGDGSLTPEAYRHLMTQSRDVFSRHFGASLVSRVTAVLPFMAFTEKEREALAFKFITPHLTPENDPHREDIMRKVVGGYRKEEGARSLQRAAAEILLDL